MRPEQPVLLGALLERQGDDVLRTAILSGARDFRIALRACRRCQSFQRCRDWLDSGARDGYEAFCPNAVFVARTKVLAC